ncbi:Dabb family protein [Thalassobius vesicularis]|uniref:Dabb family protein n=1 Tax=Thalassobius vesicularis TaxID=1294297 RepID=A0A4S3M6P1_9RHOB|nr:Dabb family protein [Thalassobius vesicularis]THD72617.1 Dabb family protein [Thalassobius vesicularis]
MIRHVVFFSVKRPEDTERARDGLMLLAGIPYSSHFEVGRNLNTDPIPGPRVDLIVYGEFPDEAALAAFKAHPLYEQSIQIVRPLRDQRVAADFLC